MHSYVILTMIFEQSLTVGCLHKNINIGKVIPVLIVNEYATNNANLSNLQNLSTNPNFEAGYMVS